MNNKDPRIARTLREIDNAIIRLLKVSSWQDITIERICREAGINRSTFYKHYTNKADLLESFIERTLTGFNDHVNVKFILASPSRIDDAVYMDLFAETLHYLYENMECCTTLWAADIGRDIFREMTASLEEKMLSCLGADSEGTKRLAYWKLYTRLFASNAMELIRWGFGNSSTVTEKDICSIMARNMRDGLFRAFRGLVG